MGGQRSCGSRDRGGIGIGVGVGNGGWQWVPKLVVAVL